jgi:transposase
MSDGTPDGVPQTLEEAQEQIRQLQAQQAAMQAERDYLWQRTEQAEAEKRQIQDAKSQAEAEVERLKAMIAQLRRRQYGPRSERLDPDQYRLELDALHEQLRRAEAAAAAEADGDEGAAAPAGRTGKGKTGKKKPARNQGALPDDLPTIEDVVEPEAASCACCGGALHRIGEDVTEQLEWVPGYLQKRKTRRPKYGCRSCESAPVQAEAPASPVPGGLPTCSTVAQLLTAKYLDSLPLYRQSDMLARQGVHLDRSTLVRWVGAGARHLELLYDALVADVMASAKIFADETPIPTLEPGRGKTKKAYFWTYARDDRPWGGPDPPAVVYRYADGRGQDHPARHLKDFRGILQVDGYGAYGAVAKKRRATGEIVLAECWTHIRRPIYDIYASGNAPLAEEALRWISDLYAIEDEIRGCDPETRKAVRQEKSKPLLDQFDAWLEARLAELPPKDDLAKAFQRIRASWPSLTVFLDDGRVELDSNRVETLIRLVALTRKNALFAGDQAGGHTWAIIQSLTQTCKLNGVEPLGYLTDVLERITSGEAKTSDLQAMLPWNWPGAGVPLR